MRRLYSQGGAETDESTELYMVRTERVLEDSLEETFSARFTPHCAASWGLIKQRLASQ